MTEPLLTMGNTAKLHCIELIDRWIAAREGEIRIVDLGCGTALNFLPLLRKHPRIRYVGIEPSERDVVAARKNLEGFNASVIHGSAGEADAGTADVVVSFSVLEHVHDRDGYMRAAARALSPSGIFVINYDHGHFVLPTGAWWQVGSDRWKNVFGPALARLGFVRFFQSMITEGEFLALVSGAGFEIVEERFFNTDIKRLFAKVEPRRQDEFMRRWYRFELDLNEIVPTYTDDLASILRTRNYVLRLAGSPKP